MNRRQKERASPRARKRGDALPSVRGSDAERLCLPGRTEHGADLMPDHLAHGFAACGQIGARIEGFGTLRKQGPDGGGDGQPQIRINIDLANGGSGGAAEQVFGHAGGSRYIPAVRVDGSHGLLRHARRAVQHQRNARQTGGNGVKALEIKPRLPPKTCRGP